MPCLVESFNWNCVCSFKCQTRFLHSSIPGQTIPFKYHLKHLCHMKSVSNITLAFPLCCLTELNRSNRSCCSSHQLPPGVSAHKLYNSCKRCKLYLYSSWRKCLNKVLSSSRILWCMASPFCIFDHLTSNVSSILTIINTSVFFCPELSLPGCEQSPSPVLWLAEAQFQELSSRTAVNCVHKNTPYTWYI